jgi:acetate---CoA ligase (ADP-forming)
MAVGVRDVILRDGSTMRLSRPTRADRDAVLALYGRLSRESLFQRFRGGVTPDARLVDPYLDSDGEERGALIGTALGHVVALGSFDRLRDPTAAEVAFAVDDPMQGNGVGTRLLEQLVEIAAPAGIRRFVAEVGVGNDAMLSVFTDAGFEVTRRVEQGTAELSFPIAATDTYLARIDERDHVATVASLRPFFEPRSVAVVGASARRGSIGNSIVRNLLAADFGGSVHPVNLRGEPVAGVPAVGSVGEIPTPVDLAVICVPAARVVEATEQALQAGIRAICVISAGFAETGAEGRERQDRLLAAVRAHGARLLGPNCLGIAVAGSRLNATFAPRSFPAGSIGFSSQSGALGLALLERVAGRGLGLSAFVSVGNKADISTNDLLEYWEGDVETRLVLLYVESFGNPRRFGRVARRVARVKPVLAMKSGTSGSGARAAGSHTAALAGSDAAVEALFTEAGVLRVETLGEVLDLATLLTDHRLPAGNRVGVLTNAGGLGILCADACETAGLELPPLSSATTARLEQMLPTEASTGNPVDMLGSATADAYREVIPALLADAALDAVLVLFAPAAVADAEEVAAAISTAAGDAVKPVLAVVMTADGMPAAFRRSGSNVAAFAYPESAARSLGRAVQRSSWLRQPSGVVQRPAGIDNAGGALVRTLVAEGADRWLDPIEIRTLLQSYGLPVVAERIADTPDDAAHAAHELGMPVVVKIADPGSHKSDRGGVALGLSDEWAVHEAAAGMGGRVVVQPMVRSGIELLAGITQDPVFGPLVAFGPGGVLAELIGEAVFRIAPLTDVDIATMIESGKAGVLVRGFRGAPPADTAALGDLLARLSALAVDLPEVAELDLNPVIATGESCVIVDARVRVAPGGDRERVKTW